MWGEWQRCSAIMMDICPTSPTNNGTAHACRSRYFRCFFSHFRHRWHLSEQLNTWQNSSPLTHWANMASLAFIGTVSDRAKFQPFDTPIPLFLGVCGDSYYY